ncbi:Uncharacterised protein r2_g189 [Pycnogonum litorale]
MSTCCMQFVGQRWADSSHRYPTNVHPHCKSDTIIYAGLRKTLARYVFTIKDVHLHKTLVYSYTTDLFWHPWVQNLVGLSILPNHRSCDGNSTIRLCTSEVQWTAQKSVAIANSKR